MAMGIFIYGNAPATEEPGPPPLPTESDKAAEAEAAMDEDEEPGPVHTTRYANGITFVGLTKDTCPPEIRSILARMHLTFGHPESNEFIMFVAQQGASLAVIKAIKALRCAACDRSRKPKRPRPAMLPEAFQTSQPFGRVLLDVFYQEDCRGKTRPFLGVIDDAMLLHTIGRLPNREANKSGRFSETFGLSRLDYPSRWCWTSTAPSSGTLKSALTNSASTRSTVRPRPTTRSGGLSGTTMSQSS